MTSMGTGAHISTQTVKLLAPGGTLRMALTALAEGADGVYVGARGWSRRSSRMDLADEEIRELSESAAAMGREVKVALNAMPGPTEMPRLMQKVEAYAGWGVSGFVLSDPGCIVAVRRHFPTIDIHVSIGSAVTNRQDIYFYKTLGGSCIILPYRLQPDEVKAIKAEVGMNVEIFLFQPMPLGIVCPGKCIMSSYLVYKEWSDGDGDEAIGSANRGARGCSRVCQAGWEVAASDAELDGKSTLRNDPFLQLWELPGFVKAGVDYLKIQGRERSEELMQDITGFYRRLIDAIVASGADLSLEPYVPEWQELRKRWTMERTRRAGLLMGSGRYPQ